MAAVDASENGSRQHVPVDLLRSKGIHAEGHRLGKANGVAQLHLALIRQAGENDILGDVARHVCAAAVRLGGVLAGKRATTVACIAAIGIRNQLSSHQTGIAGRAADDKPAGRVDKELRSVIHQLSGKRWQNDVADNVGAQLIDTHAFALLRGNDNGVNAPEAVVLIFSVTSSFSCFSTPFSRLSH